MMQDRHGRDIRYLRLSITKACAMRCMYCRPVAMNQPRGEPMLTAGEIEAFARHMVARHRLKKVRLTGGEPTNRGDLVEIVRRLCALDALDDVAMTTNGLKLAGLAEALATAGLRRVNVSLDSLNADRFRRITGVDALHRVLEGIEAAQTAGLRPVKLNTVVVRGQNDDELGELLLFAVAKGIEIRFIELMPMGPLANSWADRYVPETQMRQELAPLVESWEALPFNSDSARRYRVTLVDGRRATVGFITAMSCPFCQACDRIRVAADGTFHPCLMDRPAGNLLPAIRPILDGEELDRLLLEGMQQKAPEHPLTGVGIMTHIGG